MQMSIKITWNNLSWWNRSLENESRGEIHSVSKTTIFIDKNMINVDPDYISYSQPDAY